MQAFLAYPNLKQVVGIELAPSRAQKGFTAIRKLKKLVGAESKVHLTEGSNYAKLQIEDRVLEMRYQNFFESADAHEADIIIMQTAFAPSSYPKLCAYVKKFKIGATLLAYENLEKIFLERGERFDFKRCPLNLGEDRFVTTWAHQVGCHFFVYVKEAASP